MTARLVDRTPVVDPSQLVAALVPPPQFADVRLQTYRPDPDEPTQAVAVERLRRFGGTVGGRPRRGLFGRGSGTPDPAGIYLDGGFGVGKTHLLASLWHLAPGQRAFGTFVEYTHLVGAIGFGPTVDALSGHTLVCIDEFELDDPGDTVLMSTLLSRLAAAGVRLAATSNTLPGSLGEGRFATDSFQREIQGLADRFEPVRIVGPDYRHRGLPRPPSPVPADAAVAWAQRLVGATCDDLDALCAHLATVHPSRYGALVDRVTGAALTGVHPVSDQNIALRLVVLVDRLYDRAVPVLTSGEPLDRLFTPELLAGGYRKKYHRCLSRLTALAREGATLST